MDCATYFALHGTDHCRRTLARFSGKGPTRSVCRRSQASILGQRIWLGNLFGKAGRDSLSANPTSCKKLFPVFESIVIAYHHCAKQSRNGRPKSRPGIDFRAPHLQPTVRVAAGGGRSCENDWYWLVADQFSARLVHAGFLATSGPECHGARDRCALCFFAWRPADGLDTRHGPGGLWLVGRGGACSCPYSSFLLRTRRAFRGAHISHSN